MRERERKRQRLQKTWRSHFCLRIFQNATKENSTFPTSQQKKKQKISTHTFSLNRFWLALKNERFGFWALAWRSTFRQASNTFVSDIFSPVENKRGTKKIESVRATKRWALKVEIQMEKFASQRFMQKVIHIQLATNNSVGGFTPVKCRWNEHKAATTITLGSNESKHTLFIPDQFGKKMALLCISTVVKHSILCGVQSYSLYNQTQAHICQATSLEYEYVEIDDKIEMK